MMGADQRLSQERVLCHEFGLASLKASQHPKPERSGVWLRPDDAHIGAAPLDERLTND
jgi:hypothetical protein